MKVAIIGTGYVGLPTGIGLSELGNQVVCIDKIEEKIASLQKGDLPQFMKTGWKICFSEIWLPAG